jgi:phosphoglycolate phosphatase-like HAD superfamily hydrolase
MRMDIVNSTTEVRVVWDMDGTLLDTTAVVPDAFVAAVLELGGPAVDRDDVVSAYSMGVPEAILEHFLGRSLRPGEDESYYQRLAEIRVDPYDGVVDSVHALRAAGHLISVFTGASTRAARSLLSAAGLDVDVLVGGDQVEHPKPAGDGLIEAARRLHVRPDALFYLGDAPTDLLAAKAAGASSVAVAWGHLYRPDAPADHTLRHPLDALHLLGPR